MKITQHLSIQSVLLLVLLLLHISPSQSKSPPASSAGAAPSTSTSSPSLLSPDERTRIYNEAYDQAVLESDLLEDDEDCLDQDTEPVASESDLLQDEELELDGADMESFVEAEVEAPTELESPSTPLAASSFPILGDPRRALETAISEQVSPEHAAELHTALARIRAREGWPTALELESQVVRIQAWQDVLLAELEAQGTLPEFARLFTQPAERYVAPVLSQYAWPPLYALERDGGYADSFAFGEGGTLTESIVRRMGELESSSIVGNIDASYVSFPGSCTGRHPLTRYLSDQQRSALNRFHSRVYRSILNSPRIVLMNGGDVETDLLLPLVAGGVFESDNIDLTCRVANLQTTLELRFIRPTGAATTDSSLLIRRCHPQALDQRSRPSLFMQLLADVASELIRSLAHRGNELPSPRTFLGTFAQSTIVIPGDSNEPLEPARVPLEYRLAHLARIERGMDQPFTLEHLETVDRPVARAVREVLQRVPVPNTDPYPCPEHIAGSPLQQARHRLTALAAKSQCQTNALLRKVRWRVTMTTHEQKLLDEANARIESYKKVKAAHPKRTERWRIKERDRKRERSEAEVARALAQDQASYRRRSEEMPPEEREGRLEEQSLRSNVRNLNVVAPSDFLSFLGAPPPAPLNPNSPEIAPIPSGSNSLLPIVGSSSGTFHTPGFQLPFSNFTSASNTLPGESLPGSLPLDARGSGTKGEVKKPRAKKVIPKIKEEEEEEEEELEPAPSGKGKGVKRKNNDDPSMRRKDW